MRDDQLQEKITELIKDQGAQVIEFRIILTSGKKILRCLIDYPEGGIGLDACAKINKKICVFLEENDIFNQQYLVEINSPGLDRKMYAGSDFKKAKAREVSLWLNEPVMGKEYLEGVILDVREDEILLDCKGNTIEIDLKKIKVGKEIIKI